ncbi:conjugal transfer protein TrbB, partial [Pseudomonas aeruginosa]
NPILECELPLDGSRFEALKPPVVSAPTVTIRKKAVKVFTLENYVASQIMTPVQCVAIKDAVTSRRNILVVGGTGTG